MLDMGIIQPSTSPWASPIVLVEKKDGNVRFCVDYRKLNLVSKFDAYPMPRVEEVLESVSAAKFISTLDCLHYTFRALRVPGNAFWAPQRTSYIPKNDE